MIEFYIELGGLAIDPSYRLQSDKTSWRKLESDELVDSDFISSDVYELIQLQMMDEEITLDGVTYAINPAFDHKRKRAETLHYDIFVRRSYFPNTPTVEQLRATIQHGDDRLTNTLILNVYGFFELREWSTVNITFEDPTIIARTETFGAGNDYVGQAAAEDENFIASTYEKFISAWANHIQSGTTNMFTSEEVPTPLNEALAIINGARIEFERAEIS